MHRRLLPIFLSSQKQPLDYTGFELECCIPPGGFEPPSPDPKSCMIDHYTTGVPDGFLYGQYGQKKICPLLYWRCEIFNPSVIRTLLSGFSQQKGGIKNFAYSLFPVGE